MLVDSSVSSGHSQHPYDAGAMATAERVREVRERLLETGTVTGRAVARVHELFPVAVGLNEGLALTDWVRRERAQATLETGLGFALSTLFVFEGLLANTAEPRHVACDPFQFESLPGHRTRYHGVGLEILEDAGIRHFVEFHAEPSQIVLPRLLAGGRRFDLAFIDGNHRFEGVFVDLFYCGHLLKEGGIVFVDDTQFEGVRRAVNFFVANLGWVAEDEGADDDSHSWIVVRTGSQDAFYRRFDEFAEF